MDGNFSRTEPNADAAPIDHAHLGRYTLGNRALEIEVLQLFAGEAPLTLDKLRAASCEKAWHIAAHTLKGSARAVGAWTIGSIAEAAEREGYAAAGRAETLDRLDAAIGDVAKYVSALS